MQDIDALFAQWNRSDSPGAVAVVTRHGAEIHAGAYGMASLAHSVPLDRRSVVRIGSQTKQFTVLLALLLEQQGKLSMEDEVHRYAPWMPPTPQPITLEHLARNTSGLRDFLEMMTWSGLGLGAPSSRQTARDLISRHAEVNFAPGSAMIYCNTGFFLLSEIIEEVSGRSYNELLAGHLTGRFGMADSRLVGRDSETLPRLADMHLHTARGWETARWGLVLGGEGGMVASADDMLKWQAMLANPPADLAPLLARMEAPVPFTNGTPATYAMGLVRADYRGQTGISHGGGVAGGKSTSIRFRESGLGVVLLANLDDFAAHPLSCRIADIVLEPELGPRPALPDLSAHAGLWREEDGDDLLTLADQSLITSGGAVSLEMPEPGLFAPERPTAHFRFATPVDGVMQAVSCGRATRYRKLGPAPTASLAGLAGDYGNATLGIFAHLSPDGGLSICSDVGGSRYSVAWADRDLLLVLPPGGATAGRPFAATLRLVDGGMVLTTDRTRGLGLKRIR
jgi:CubicO group peptidase (beta-lactamase class C family)